MPKVPLLQDDDEEVQYSLSLEEIRIAMNSLRKRFREYTIEQIVQALTNYLSQKQINAQCVPISRNYFPPQFSRLPEPNFTRHLPNPQIPRSRTQRVEQLRFVALLFIESGINYDLIRRFFPEMSKKEYHLDLQTITVQTLNSIEKFLKLEHNVQVDFLTRSQKLAVKEKLVQIRDWMAKTHPQQMKTYFAFIERHYLCETLEIEFKMAIDLHRVILEAARGPELQIRDVESNTNRGLAQNFSIVQEAKQRITKEQENSLVLLFKKYCSADRVSDAMCLKYGYHVRWSVHSVKNMLMRIYKVSLKRLVNANKRILKDKSSLYFGYGEEDVKLLMEYENSLEIKLLLLEFYILAKITILKLREYVRKVNEFFIKQYRGDTGVQEIPSDDDLRIPTLINQSKPRSYVVIKDQEDIVIRDERQFHTKSKKIRKNLKKPNKKPSYKEFIDLAFDSENQERQVFLSPQRKPVLEKNAQDDTDIEDQLPKSTREKEIFRPQPRNSEKKKQKQALMREINERHIFSEKIVQERPQRSQSIEKSLIPPQKTTSQKPAEIEVKVQFEPIRLETKETQIPSQKPKKPFKKKDLDRSFGSINSEPSYLENYCDLKEFRQKQKRKIPEIKDLCRETIKIKKARELDAQE